MVRKKMADPRTDRRAVVIGAGIGGLTAARALSESFETVIVLERDELAATRARAPADRHVHALLAGGLKALADLFPGIEDDLLRAGAVPMCTARIDEILGFVPPPRARPARRPQSPSCCVATVPFRARPASATPMACSHWEAATSAATSPSVAPAPASQHRSASIQASRSSPRHRAYGWSN